jgi:hypothetical protein
VQKVARHMALYEDFVTHRSVSPHFGFQTFDCLAEFGVVTKHILRAKKFLLARFPRNIGVETKKRLSFLFGHLVRVAATSSVSTAFESPPDRNMASVTISWFGIALSVGGFISAK